MLWLLRDGAVGAPHYDLKDLVKLDDRLEAHLDGLRIAGDAGWEICLEQLGFEEAGEVFAAGYVALETDNPERLEKVLEVVAKEPGLRHPLVSALEWQEPERAFRKAKGFLNAESVLLREVGIRGMTALRRDPGTSLKALLEDPDPGVQAHAARAVGHLGRSDFLLQVKGLLSSAEDAVQGAAAWTTTLLSGDPVATGLLQKQAEAGGIGSHEAAMLLVRKMSPEWALKWWESLRDNPDRQRFALFVAGQLGDPVVVPWLFEKLPIPELARPAGEVLTFLTGVDLAYEDLEGEWPEGFEAGPGGDPEDGNVDLDPDEDLPWPEPELVRDWWSGRANACKNGTRYLMGKAISAAVCEEVLRTGRQRQRVAAALELACLNPGTVLYHTSAPGFRQKKELLQPPLPKDPA